jgi:hypothetical protein
MASSKWRPISNRQQPKTKKTDAYEGAKRQRRLQRYVTPRESQDQRSSNREYCTRKCDRREIERPKPRASGGEELRITEPETILVAE